MQAVQRRQKILELIRVTGSARVSDLSSALNVTEPTIRNDLLKIEEDGEILREHGGAYIKPDTLGIREITLPNQDNLLQKQAIGRKASEFISDGDSIILDSGSTTAEIAKNILDRQSLKVITIGLNITLLLGNNQNIEVHMTGGEFNTLTLSLTGDRAAEFFNHAHVDKLFLATAGFSFKAGLMYPGFRDISVKNAMIEAANEVYIVADSSKIGKSSFAALGGPNRIQYLITDNLISSEQRQMIESHGIKIIVAEL